MHAWLQRLSPTRSGVPLRDRCRSQGCLCVRLAVHRASTVGLIKTEGSNKYAKRFKIDYALIPKAFDLDRNDPDLNTFLIIVSLNESIASESMCNDEAIPGDPQLWDDIFMEHSFDKLTRYWRHGCGSFGFGFESMHYPFRGIPSPDLGVRLSSLRLDFVLLLNLY